MRSNSSKSSEVALNFVEAINSKDLNGLEALMSEDHNFIDGLGNVIFGKSAMREAWNQYFRMFPDYRIEIQNIMNEGAGIVGIFGTASGTFSGQSNAKKAWKIPAAWRASIKNGLVEEWQVYADNEPVWKTIGVRRY